MAENLNQSKETLACIDATIRVLAVTIKSLTDCTTDCEARDSAIEHKVATALRNRLSPYINMEAKG